MSQLSRSLVLHQSQAPPVFPQRPEGSPESESRAKLNDGWLQTEIGGGNRRSRLFTRNNLFVRDRLFTCQHLLCGARNLHVPSAFMKMIETLGPDGAGPANFHLGLTRAIDRCIQRAETSIKGC